MKNDMAEKSVQKPKTSRLAIASLVIAILSILFPPIAIIAIILAIGGILKIRKNTGRLKGTRYITGAMIASALSIVLWTMAFIVWTIDADPIPNDYTIEDLRSAPSECNQSYYLLLSLFDKESEDDLNMPDFIEEINAVIADSDEPNKIDALNAWIKKKSKRKPSPAPSIGLSGDDKKTINEFGKVIRKDNYPKIIEYLKSNTYKISQAWENAQKGRDIIKELNKFPEIADLSEPSLETKLSFLANLRLLTRLYQVYAYLQIEQGNSQSAVSELTEINSVFRKLSINSRAIPTKLVCLACLEKIINTTNFVANHTSISKESLDLLTKHFTPLTNEQTSLRNIFVFEHLLFTNTLDIHFQQFIKHSPFSLKRNSTLRLHRNLCDPMIDYDQTGKIIKKQPYSVWPSIYPNWMPEVNIWEPMGTWQYKCYNPAGCLFYGKMAQSLDTKFRLKIKLKIQDDLFQIILNKRLGKEISLKARAYSDEYIIDVDNKKIFSPGPDGIPHTKDDIKLIINPEVLNLTN